MTIPIVLYNTDMRRTNTCPWCKAEMEERWEQETYYKVYYLYCKECNSQGPTYTYFTKDNKKIYDVDRKKAMKVKDVSTLYGKFGKISSKG